MPTLPVLDRKPSRPLIGFYLSEPAPGILERIGADWDWIWIDGQHGNMDYREAADLVRSSNQIGRPGLVRIPLEDLSWVGKMLDAGAAGIIAPMVETLDQAKALVRAAKFPPSGNRSYGGRRVIDRLGRGYYRSANQETALILQVESNEAVGLADEMAALEGVDGLFLGPDDLTIRLGLPVESPRSPESIGRQCQTMVDSCRRHGKLSVVSIGLSDDAMAMAKNYRFDLIAGGSDAFFLTAGSKSYAEKWRNLFKS